MKQPFEIATQITNSRGVPGTMSCIAHNLHDGRPVLLSTHHVIFSEDAAKGSAVSAIQIVDGRHVFHPIGRSLYGKLGTLRFENQDYYVDCAVASYERPDLLSSKTPWAGAVFQTAFAGFSTARIGSRVTKTGAATGATTGIVADLNYSDTLSPHTYTPKQILIKPTEGHLAFCAEGDSGALIIDDANQVVGLLWGTNCRGEGVACHIAPVLFAMNIKLNASPAFCSG
jgi:hypothetical protein